jgi:medium-chain acyl-[acyl-carrier-protein] hydrolase
MSAAWILPLSKRTDATGQLFCFAYAGGGSHVFREWASLLPVDLDVFAIVPPGRGSRFSEALVTDFDDLVTQIADEIIQYADRPITLFGHSLGASVAYEVARILEANGVSPGMVFVSGRQAPHVPSRRAPIAHLPDAAFLAGLAQMGGTPAEILASRELVDLLLPMLRADFALAETYRERPGPRLTCPLEALGASGDPLVDRAGLEAWRVATSGSFNVHMFPGDHFYLHAHMRPLLAHIGSRIAAGDGGAAQPALAMHGW